MSHIIEILYGIVPNSVNSLCDWLVANDSIPSQADEKSSGVCRDYGEHT